MIGVFTLITEVLLPVNAYKCSVDLGHFTLWSSPSLVPLHTIVFSNFPLCSVNLAATSVVNPGTRTIATASILTISKIGEALTYSTSISTSRSQIVEIAETTIQVLSILYCCQSLTQYFEQQNAQSLSSSSSPQAYFKYRLLSLTPPAMSAVIAVGLISALEAAFLFVFLLWLLRQKRNKDRNGASNNADGNIVPMTTVVPDIILTPVLPSSPPSARVISVSTIESLASDLPRRLSQSSRNAYEEEIERLRQEVLAQKNHIRYMHEQMELTHISSPPPSYRSRRSNTSDYFGSSSPLPPLPPLPSPLMQPRPVLDRAYVI
ncbi:hypothetical protein ARMGADRAFT_1077478 [Armillaria gallica]|uniref:Uncharacterized protein n=1 Tax=Armillaria gallica TaxID=47427 RepID=A0A2H3DL65_ARMGA|nr:hypothetical protein ARMGADRAFT_1077478 [Armillaria gallica]